MATVTFILGLCGAGKTELARRIAGVEVIDENFFYKLPQLITALRQGKDCVVTEIQFCLEPMRQWIVQVLNKEVPGTRIIWRPIEKDLEKANENCRRPERKITKPDYDAESHVRINAFYYPRYTYPEGVPVEKMWPYDNPAG